MEVYSFLGRYVAAFLIGIGFIISPAPGALSAAAASPAAALPDAEIRSLITGINVGKAPAAGDEEKKARAELLNRGRKAALEKTRNRLQGLEKFGMGYDLGRTPAASVKVLRQEELPTGTGERPRFWLEAETGFVLKDKRTGGRPEAALLDRADLLDVRLWSDRKEYEEGEKITLSLRGNRNFYGKVVQIDTKGSVLQILPNNYRQIASFDKDKLYRVPDEGDRYQLDVRPPFGMIRFIVYATRLPMSQVNLQAITGGIFKYRSSPQAFGRSVRHVVPAGEEQGTEFVEAQWTIKTVPRR